MNYLEIWKMKAVNIDIKGFSLFQITKNYLETIWKPGKRETGAFFLMSSIS